VKTVLLIRHGATAGNMERRYIGRTDEPLCEEGLRQIAALKEKQLWAERIFVSPLCRARQTAELLFPDRPYTVLDGLRETDFGAFEGKTSEELSADAAYQSWVDSWCKAPIPGGEGKDAVSDRAAAAFGKAMADTVEGNSAAFVTHGGVIMALLERLGAEKGDFYEYHIRNGGYLRCAWDGELLRVIEKG